MRRKEQLKSDSEGTQRIEWIDRDMNRYYMIISYYNTLVQEATAKTECVKWKHGQYFFKKT